MPRRPLAPNVSLPRLALALACLLFPAAVRAETHLRLRPTLRAGAGLGTDLFLGAQLGAGFEGLVAPALRLDVSQSPSLKGWASYDFAFNAYQVTRSAAFDHGLEVGGRCKLAGELWGALALSGQYQSFTETGPVGDTVGISASQVASASAEPSLRYRAGDLDFDVRYQLQRRRNAVSTGDIDDWSHAASLSAAWSRSSFTVVAAPRFISEVSTSPLLAYTGFGGDLALLLGPVEPLVLKLFVSPQRNAFADRVDVLTRAGVLAMYAVTDWLFWEGSYSYAYNASSEADYTAGRHFGYVGFRVEGDVWRR